MIGKADRLLADAERIRAVILQQRDLADRMEQFRNMDESTPQQRKRMAQFAKQQELLPQELAEVMEDLEQAAEDVQDDLPRTAGDALKLCQRISNMEVLADQDNTARMARAGSGSQAHGSADEAARKLESLLSDCCNPQGLDGEMSLDPGLGLSRQQMLRSLQ